MRDEKNVFVKTNSNHEIFSVVGIRKKTSSLTQPRPPSNDDNAKNTPELHLFHKLQAQLQLSFFLWRISTFVSMKRGWKTINVSLEIDNQQFCYALYQPCIKYKEKPLFSKLQAQLGSSSSFSGDYSTFFRRREMKDDSKYQYKIEQSLQDVWQRQSNVA